MVLRMMRAMCRHPLMSGAVSVVLDATFAPNALEAEWLRVVLERRSKVVKLDWCNWMSSNPC